MSLSLKEAKNKFPEKYYQQIKKKIHKKKNRNSNFSILSKKEKEKRFENRLYEVVANIFKNREVYREYLFIPGRKFKADVAIPELKLVFELDGYRHHGLSKYGFKRDREKDRLGHLNGYRIIRFFATELKEDNIKNVKNFLIELKKLYDFNEK